MEEFLKYLEGCELSRLGGGDSVTLDDGVANLLHVVTNPEGLDLRVTSRDRAARLVILRSGGEAENGGVRISVESGAKLDVVELMCDFNIGDVTIEQSTDSALNYTIYQLSSSELSYKLDMCGKGAECEVNILQLPTATDRVACDLKISHLSPNCSSRSTSKCVASGESVGEFHGLVYVAQGAQQTLSEQSSRNIALSREAKIIAEPQLEIYADDVKCTHGATMGQMDRDAILYMRQRGLSEEQARKVQLDGFVADVTMACRVDELREALVELVRKRLYDL